MMGIIASLMDVGFNFFLYLAAQRIVFPFSDETDDIRDGTGKDTESTENIRDT